NVPHRAVGQRLLGDELLLDELAFSREDLNPVVNSVADVHQSIFRKLGAVYRVAELLRRRRGRIVRSEIRVVRLVSIGAPIALEHAGLGIHHHDTVVAVTVRDICFVVRIVYENLGYLAERPRVVAPGIGVSEAELFDELALARELEHLAVDGRVSADPHHPFPASGNSIIGLGPFVALAWTTPR